MSKFTVKLTEPKSPRYIYLDSRNNRIHLMLPVVSGSAGIGLDNTCKSVYATQEFFGKQFGLKGQSALVSLSDYQQALELDIALIPEYVELRKQKEDRLEQVKFYINILKGLTTHPLLQGLKTLLPQYPNPLQHLMKQKDTNLYSMVLRPRLQDLYLRTVNPTFSLPHDILTDGERVRIESSFYNRTMDIFKTIELKAMDKRAKLIAAVIASEAGQTNNFMGLQQELQKEVKSRLGETVDFTQKSKAAIEEELGFDQNSSSLEYIEALLGYCAPKLFESDNQSPFDTIEPGTTDETKQNAYDKLSILTQFFLAEINIFCVAQQKTTQNFGMILEKKEAFATELASRIKSSIINEASVEEVVLDFINAHKENPLTEADKEKIKKQFRLHYSQVKDSPHFDEFMVMDAEKPGLFVVHQGAICTDFGEFIQAAILEDSDLRPLNNFYLNRICEEFKTINGQLAHKNSLYTKEEEKIEIKVDFTNLSDKQLELLIKQLPQKEKDRIYDEVPEVMRRIIALKIPSFLRLCADGRLDKLNFLNSWPEEGKQYFLRKQDHFTDLAGRTFNCSAFEYAYWAKDTPTMRTLLEYMDEETKAEMALRAVEIEQDGLSYTQNGQEFKSSHFDLTSLKNAYTTYIAKNYDGTINISAWNEAWLNIGKEQLLLPVHILKEYCDPKSSFFVSSFPTRQDDYLTIYNMNLNHHRFGMYVLWSPDFGMGTSLSLFRGTLSVCGAASLPNQRQRSDMANADLVMSHMAGVDLASIKHLDSVRNAELMAIRAELREAITTPTPGCSIQ